MREETNYGGLILILYLVVCWIVNLIKLLNCDFEAPYKEEIIHLIGLTPIISGVTAWF